MILCPRCGKLNDAAAANCIDCQQILGAGAPPSAPTGNNAPTNAAASLPPFRPVLPYHPQAPFGNGALASGAIPYAMLQPTLRCLTCGWTPDPMSTRPIRSSACPQCKVPFGSVANPNDITCSSAIPYTGSPVRLQLVSPWPVSAAPSQSASWNWGAAILTIPWALRKRQGAPEGRRWALACACTLNLLIWIVIGFSLPAPSGAATNPAATTGAVEDIFTAGIMVGSILFWFIKTIYLGTTANAPTGAIGWDHDALLAEERWSLRWAWIGAAGLLFTSALLLWHLF